MTIFFLFVIIHFFLQINISLSAYDVAPSQDPLKEFQFQSSRTFCGQKCQHSVQYASRNLDSFAVLLHVKNVVHVFANIVQRKTYARGQYNAFSLV